VQTPGWSDLPWQKALEKLKTISLTKYCDFNLKNLIYPLRQKHTFEIRILPVHLELAPLLAEINLMAAVIQRARETIPVEPQPPLPIGPETLSRMMNELPISPSELPYWQTRIL
jgi:hypothetical protein